VIPPKVTKSGRYTVVWRALSNGEAVRRRITVQIAKSSTKAQRSGTACKTVGVLVNGPRFGPEVTGKLRGTTRLTATTTSSLFSMIASPNRNVQVVVVDVDRFGLQPVSDLRLVFPNIRILALSRDAASRAKAQQAGATTALSPGSSTLGSTIERLAHPTSTCTAEAKAAAAPVRQAARNQTQGSAATALQTSLNSALAAQTIQFESGSAVLTAAGRATLDRLLVSLRSHPEARVRIEGYTDDQGPAAGNLKLSRDRAVAVQRYLVAHGIAASHLSAVGFGESRPIASNSTEAGRAQNRRIELRVVG
jgi:outer membrane protein OmpA-like peptidoglycan-associated protein